MKLWPLFLIGMGALADGGTELPQPTQFALTPIDTVPTPAQLDSAFTGCSVCSPADHQQTLASLAMIANDPGNDDGSTRAIRLRAIHALSRYCTAPCNDADTAHVALATVIGAHASELAGFGVVLLRGAVEAIGPQRVSTDLPLLVPLLEHPSRDVRAATAHALRDLCNTQAINPLRVRLQHEATDQVKLAISDALRILNQTPCQ